MRSTLLARVVFVALALATVAAFFITQRLKSSDPVVSRIATPLYLSPNGDRQKDVAKIGFMLPKSDNVTVAIVTEAGNVRRTLMDDKRLHKGQQFVVWDGRDDDGQVVRDGFYYVRVSLLKQGRAATGPRPIQVVTKGPKPRLVSVRRVSNYVEIRYDGPSSPPPVFRVWNTDGPKPKQVEQFVGTRNSNIGKWVPFVGLDPAPPGHYAFSVTVRNKALVAGSSPVHLPPTRAEAAPSTGFDVVPLDLAPPLEPVTAGGLVRVSVGGPSRRFRWKLVRLGSIRQLRIGEGSGHTLAFRVPADAPQGVYTLSVNAAGHRASVPIAVRAPGDHRVLVVLPAITWQGLNAVDGDANGFTETLEDSDSVFVGRPFADGRLPAGFAPNVAPLMRFLGRRDYDLTTDLALARGKGPQLAGHSGVLFPGSERWLTDKVDIALRDYVLGGGKVAYFGGDSFRRSVRLTDKALAGPSKPNATNLFGERSTVKTGDPAPIVKSKDDLNLFAGTDGLVGEWRVLEPSTARVGNVKLLTAAGRDPNAPALVGYQLGRGTVVRVGVPGWAATLDQDGEEAKVTRRIWALLSR